jgi:hypothetical protein
MTKMKGSLHFTLDGRTAYKHIANEKPYVKGDIIYVLCMLYYNFRHSTSYFPPKWQKSKVYSWILRIDDEHNGSEIYTVKK